MTTSVSTPDFEGLQGQMRLLRDKLEGQAIVNDRLIKQAVGTKLHSLRRDGLVMALVALLGAPYCALVFHHLHLSWLFTAVTMVFLVVAFIYNRVSMCDIGPSLLAECSFVDVGRLVVRMKRRQARWLRFSLPFLLVWLPWFVWEVCAAVELSVEYRSGVLCGSAVGAVVGGVLGYVQYRKSVRLASEILELLE